MDLRSETASMNTMSLLDLPAEIRQIVLTDLLHHQSSNGRLPQFADPNPPRLFPAILSTCSQLHEEGVRLLYSHTLHFEIHNSPKAQLSGQPSSAYNCAPVYLGRTFSLDSIPSSIIRRVSSVNVQVHARRVNGVINLSHIQAAVRQVTKLIEAQPHWQHLTLRAYTSANLPLDEASGTWPDVVQPFLPMKRLRERASVECDGVDPLLAAGLASLATTSVARDIYDLDAMYEELQTLVHSMEPPPRPAGGRRTETDFTSIRSAQEFNSLVHLCVSWVEPRRDLGDVPGFMTARMHLLEKMRLLLQEHQTAGTAVQAISGDPNWVAQELDRLLQPSS